MENMATALLHAGQMALHIDRIEWGKRTRQSQGSYSSSAFYFMPRRKISLNEIIFRKETCLIAKLLKVEEKRKGK
jgi:hypothetical protein